jgi:hypothetical protein
MLKYMVLTLQNMSSMWLIPMKHAETNPKIYKNGAEIYITLYSLTNDILVE